MSPARLKASPTIANRCPTKNVLDQEADQMQKRIAGKKHQKQQKPANTNGYSTLIKNFANGVQAKIA
jgi:hypothetical protein